MTVLTSTLDPASAAAGEGSASVAGNQVQFDPGTDFDHLAEGENALGAPGEERREPFDQVADHVRAAKGHTRTTVLNVMTRLVAKGYLTRRKAGRFHRHRYFDRVVGVEICRVVDLSGLPPGYVRG